MQTWFDSLPPLPRTPRRVLVGIAVSILLGVYALEVTSSSRALSAIWDEPTHIMAGYRYWQAGDYGVNPEHPPLAKLVGAVPLLLMRLKVPSLSRDVSKPMIILQGRALVYRNDADALLLRARLAEAVLGLILVLILVEAGYRMFGAGVAWIAALIAIFEPNLLAHSALVGTDFAGACFALAAVYALWRAAEEPALRRLVACGAMTGLALASKHSALLLIPTLALLAGVEAVCRAKIAAREKLAYYPTLRRQAGLWAARLAIIYAFAVLVLWGFYAFRYSARPDGLPLWAPLAQYTTLLKGHFTAWLVNGAARFKLLPESYLFGLTDVLMVTAGPRLSFLLGRLYPRAVWYYFPAAFVIKSTLGFLALLILSLAVIKSWGAEYYRRAAYVLIPPSVFMGVALTAGTNMGIRHVLPIYPFLILAAAAGAWELARRRPAWAVVVGALLVCHAASSLHALPDYLAYSNELFGGTSRTYLSLSDSNTDWGQGLREAGQYLARRGVKDCWLAYFGTADPAYYHVPCKPLPDPYLRWWRDPIQVPPPTVRGVVLVAATELAAPYWGTEVLNPYAHFLRVKPAANIGGSTLVFEGEVDLRRASAVARMYRAWDLIQARNPEGAIQQALEAEDLAPDHPGAPFIIGYILAQQKRTEAARLQFETVLKLAQAANPEYQPLWTQAAKAQLAVLP